MKQKWIWSFGGMTRTRGKRKYSEKNVSQRHSGHHKPHTTSLARKPGLCGRRPATNRSSHRSRYTVRIALRVHSHNAHVSGYWISRSWYAKLTSKIRVGNQSSKPTESTLDKYMPKIRKQNLTVVISAYDFRDIISVRPQHRPWDASRCQDSAQYAHCVWPW